MSATRKIATKVFPKEDPEKPWTEKKKYKNWVNKLKKKRQSRRTKYEDLCVGSNSICKGDLGIPRKYMPQFTTKDDVKQFQKFVSKVYHIPTFSSTRKASQLRPSQSEISRKRVNHLIMAAELEAVSRHRDELAAKLVSVSRHRDELLEAQRAAEGVRDDAKQDIKYSQSLFNKTNAI